MKKVLIISIILAALMPLLVSAQTDENPNVYFRAEVLKILDEKINQLPDGQSAKQQDLLLKPLEGDYVGQEIVFKGIDGYGIVAQPLYQTGDKVLVVASVDYESNINFYVTDYVRTGSLWWLLGIFVLSILAVGKWKGFRSILSLVLSFVVIIKYIIPNILSGSNPIMVTMIGSFIILIFVIYLTEGFNSLSHISFICIMISLLFTVLLSYIFVTGAKLTGIASEDVAHLVNIGNGMVNFTGLLLAGIIIGTLGVLDDVIISQVAAVKEIHETDRSLEFKELYARAFNVGTTHIASMTNTLFLAYAGVSLPLLILFSSGQSAFGTVGQVINNEAIATEIIRTLAGSTGLILSVPLATLVATIWYTKKHK